MKVGDVIRIRDAWERTTDGGRQPRRPDTDWDGPMLITDQFPPPDQSLFCALYEGREIVVNVMNVEKGLVEIEVLNESR